MYQRILVFVFLSIFISINKGNCQRVSATDSIKTDLLEPDSESNYFYSDDLLIGGTTYWLACKEITRKGIKKFQFDLLNRDESQSFEMTNIGTSDKIITIFKTELQKTFESLNKSGKDSLTQKDNTELMNQLDMAATRYLFEAYRNNIEVADSSIVVGTLLLNNKIAFDTLTQAKADTSSFKMKDLVPMFFKKSDKKEQKKDTIEIKRVDIKFELEQIADIKVIGEKNKQKKKVVFQNRIPISYSTKADVSRDKKIKNEIKLYDTQDSFYIKMGDVFTNDYRLLNRTENYSPKDQIVTLIPNRTETVLMKENVTNILKAQVFTDLLGLNNTQTNGLIQTEVSHRVYLNRRVKQWGHSYSYIGCFNSIMPKITISKIEDNNKYLVPEKSTGLCVNIIDIYKHTNWNTGGELNLFYWGIPFFHSIFYVNAGAYILHIPMKLPELEEGQEFKKFQDIRINKDDNTFNINMIAFFPEVHWILSPHSKFQLDYNAKWYYLYNPSNDIDVVAEDCYLPTSVSDKNKWILSLKFLASVKLNNNSNGEIFFRTFYNLSLKNPSSNYLQTQLGYAFNIFDKKRGM